MFAAVKTSLNDGSTDPNLAQEVLVVFKPGTGAFEQTTIARTGDCVSRPQIMLDTENNLVRAFHTAPSTTVSGCAFSGVAGSIYEKTASMDNPVFGTGRGTAGHRGRELGQHEQRDQHQAERELRDRDRGDGHRPRRPALLVLGPQPRHAAPAAR